MSRCTCGRSCKGTMCYVCKRRQDDYKAQANRIRKLKRARRILLARADSVRYYLKKATLEELTAELERRGYTVIGK